MLLSEDLESEDVVVALAMPDGGWAAGAGSATATPPPTERPTTISSAPAPASAGVVRVRKSISTIPGGGEVLGRSPPQRPRWLR